MTFLNVFQLQMDHIAIILFSVIVENPDKSPSGKLLPTQSPLFTFVLFFFLISLILVLQAKRVHVTMFPRSHFYVAFFSYLIFKIVVVTDQPKSRPAGSQTLDLVIMIYFSQMDLVHPNIFSDVS